MKDETVWLNANQMSELFGRDSKTIRKHIDNALKEELDNSTVANFATVQKEGNRNITRNIEYYNLDMIISVGYRVKSKNGIVFRKWANKIIKDYLIKGYAVNNKRLEYLEKTIKLLDIAGRINGELSANEAQSIIKVINKYSNALNLLDKYDYKKVSKPKGTKNNKKITYEECINIINTLRFNNYSDLFALERNNGLKGIIDDIYSTFDGSDLYSTVEEKAANMLYLVTKNHVFIDGNKRIAATLFIYFLNYYGLLYNEKGMVIDNNTLVAVTILIAQSDPKKKSTCRFDYELFKGRIDMRKFNYITDYSLINSSVRGYIIELEKELAMLIDMEKDNNIYIEAYRKLKEFKNKYSDMHDVYNKILNDLLSNESVEYCVKNGKYKEDASLVGLEFEKRFKRIICVRRKM